MSLRQTCKYCGEETLAVRLLGFYVGSNKQADLWECRSVLAFGQKRPFEGLSGGIASQAPFLARIFRHFFDLEKIIRYC